MEQQQDGSLWNAVELDVKASGECTVTDFCVQLLPEEYKLELFKHEREWDNLQQKLKYRVTNEGKKSILSHELNLTIEYLENEEQGEFRQIYGDLSQTTLDKVIDKVKVMAQIIQKSSMWREMSNKEKKQFLAIRNLRRDIINENMPFKESYRILLGKIGLRILTGKEIEKGKGNKSTLNRQAIEFVNSLFYDHFQVKLNKLIQNELKKFTREDEYLSKEVIEETVEEDNMIVINKPKIKQRIANDGITSLSLKQTALFFNFLRQEKVIFKDESFQSKENIYKAIQAITGYSKQTLKEAMNENKLEENDKVVTLKMFEKLSHCK